MKIIYYIIQLCIVTTITSLFSSLISNIIRPSEYSNIHFLITSPLQAIWNLLFSFPYNLFIIILILCIYYFNEKLGRRAAYSYLISFVFATSSLVIGALFLGIISGKGISFSLSIHKSTWYVWPLFILGALFYCLAMIPIHDWFHIQSFMHNSQKESHSYSDRYRHLSRGVHNYHDIHNSTTQLLPGPKATLFIWSNSSLS